MSSPVDESPIDPADCHDRALAASLDHPPAVDDGTPSARATLESHRAITIARCGAPPDAASPGHPSTGTQLRAIIVVLTKSGSEFLASTLTAIILTYNEEQHLARCLKSLAGVADHIIVVDSFSTDRTTHIAAEFGATVLQNPFVNHAAQFNWVLDTGSIRTEWCLRIDADEYLTDHLRRGLRSHVLDPALPEDVAGFYVNRVISFAGQRIRWGGCHRIPVLRVFRTGSGRSEQRWMDEHIVLTHGSTRVLVGDLVDDNLNNIGWWSEKHNRYATCEAIELMRMRSSGALRAEPAAVRLSSREGRKRFLKERIYSRLPGGLRAAMYFVYRYVLLLGFLDGPRGFQFHFLQGFWYRVLVDAKVAEIERRTTASRTSWQETVFREYGIRVD